MGAPADSATKLFASCLAVPMPTAPAISSPTVQGTPQPLSALLSLHQLKPVAKQLEEASIAALPNNPTIEDLHKVVCGPRRFVLESQLSKRGSKGRKSWIRHHGEFLVELDRVNKPIGPYWCCSYCARCDRPEFFAVTATTSAIEHLRK
jgi:hypothetical protein